MELMISSSSAISKRYWKLCTYGSFIGFLMFVLFINQNRYHIFENISSFRSTVIFSSSLPDHKDDQFNHSSTSSSSNKQVNKEASKFSTTLAAANDLVNNSSSNSVISSEQQLSTPPAVVEIDQELPKNMSSEAAGNSTWKETNLEATKPADGDSSTAVDEKRYCDIFDGRWVYKADGEYVPPYNKRSCPFTATHSSCRNNGRPDFDYEKWSWEPRDCSDIPVFNGTNMLERLRGKRIIIVGDSLNKNMWESLACLLYTSTPSSRFAVTKRSEYKALRAEHYNFVLEFYWSPFLVELDRKHKSGSSKVLVLDKLPSSSNHWKGADVMIFNSAHWWMHKGSLRSWNLFEYKNEPIKDMKIELAYEKGLTTWANWIKQNVDPTKTTVFFRSFSPEHHGKNRCFNWTTPIVDHSSYKQRFPQSMVDIVDKKIKEMGNGNLATAIKYLNITKMSEYRIDAHPSVYAKYGGGLDKIDAAHADCSHWCLPGLPDTWNRLLYVSLFFDTSTSKHAS